MPTLDPKSVDTRLIIDHRITRKGDHYVAYGEYSDVWVGEMSNPGAPPTVVALKVLRGASNERGFLLSFRIKLQHEASRWQVLEHVNVVPFFGLCYELGRMPALVLPYYEKGSVLSYMKSHANASNEEKMAFTRGIANGLQYLHSQEPPIVHGDIRGANIFVDNDGNAKLADYGLAFIINASDFTSVKTAGNCRWAAPEIMNPLDDADDNDNDAGAPFTVQSDIFAFAMTVIEIFTEAVPFSQKKNDSSVIFAILDGRRPEVPTFVDEHMGSLIRECWDATPANRPSAGDVCVRLKAEPAFNIFYNLAATGHSLVARLLGFFIPRRV
ncbi:hypothetical protein PLICRDRAFT_52144 [Plicaturopsis crispa FD-325 SS-3]|nr:hypothetical protein PLICRDRAFT_52144 [Plicaturopsis crispa FD-325 SS-3]